MTDIFINNAAYAVCGQILGDEAAEYAFDLFRMAAQHEEPAKYIEQFGLMVFNIAGSKLKAERYMEALALIALFIAKSEVTYAKQGRGFSGERMGELLAFFSDRIKYKLLAEKEA